MEKVLYDVVDFWDYQCTISTDYFSVFNQLSGINFASARFLVCNPLVGPPLSLTL